MVLVGVPSLLRYLWEYSIAANTIAVILGWMRGYRIWSAWATFYLISALALRYADWQHLYGPHGWYVNLWIAQQFWQIVLMIFVVREAVKPAWLLNYAATGVALAIAVATAQAHHWPDSWIESVMWIGGTAALAMGIISTASCKIYNAILAAFLLLYAALMLAGADYLTSANLGIAWDVLEIAAFSAWGISFLAVKHS